MTAKRDPFRVSSRPVCPVCKKAVYSTGRIHPQCAMKQGESVSPDDKREEAR